MNIYLSIVAYVICSASGLLLIKEVFNIPKSDSAFVWMESPLRLFFDGKFLAGFILYATGFVIWLYILSKHELSMAFPIASGALYAGLLIGSIFWLHEGVGIVRILGIFLILAGIILVASS